jgi:hypothetical protein
MMNQRGNRRVSVVYFLRLTQSMSRRLSLSTSPSENVCAHCARRGEVAVGARMT